MCADKTEHINVGVRFRPINGRERAIDNRNQRKQAESSFQWSPNTVTPLFPITRSERSRQQRDKVAKSDVAATSTEFVYDRVFAPDDTNKHIYEELGRSLVVSAMQGMHTAAFAFGQTSTGKTYTMQGTNEQPGIIPRAIEDVFTYVHDHPEREFLLRVSYLEVYNESINDLLNPSSSNLRVYEDRVKGPYVKGLEEKVVVTPEQIFALIAAGEAQRHIGCTDFNKQSSRSHTIFRLVVESKVYSEDQPKSAAGKSAVQVASLNLVDLAGSESAQSSSSSTHRTEGGFINKSLLTLTHVIFKLSETMEHKAKGKAPASVHIPYRNSKLTRILQPALQGNSRISIICTVTPWGGVKEESLNTLRFATRAKKVKRIVKVNEVVDDRALLVQYKQEIADLRKQLAEARSGASPTRTSPSAAVSTGRNVFTPPSDNGSAEMLREQIDQAIRNLNRVILNSSLTESERKHPHPHKEPHPDGGENAPGELARSTPFFGNVRRGSSAHGIAIDLAEDFNNAANTAPEQAPGNPVTPPPPAAARRAFSYDDKLTVGKASDGVATLTPQGDDTQQQHQPSQQESDSGSPGPHHARVTSELKSIRSHLEELLQGVKHSPVAPTSPTRPTGAEATEGAMDREGMTDAEYIAHLEGKVASLKKELNQHKVESSVNNADRAFLEEVLKEKVDTLAQWETVIKEVDERQAALEAENEELKRLLGEHVAGLDEGEVESF